MARDRKRVPRPADPVVRSAPVERAVQAPGQALDGNAAATMGTRLGHDFSRVRVHTDDAAAQAADALGAAALTTGEDVVFGRGRYAPGTAAGDRLLAHELAHVVQEARGGSDAGADARADAAADQAVRGQAVSPAVVGGAAPGVHLQRLGEPKAPSLGVDRPPLSVWTVSGFGHNQSALPDDAATDLDFLTRLYFSQVSTSPGSVLVLTGHTDLTGGEGYNLELGRKRGMSVALALVKRGVPLTAIRVESAGESQPKVNTQQQEPRNRRVEASFDTSAAVALPPASTGLGPQPGPATKPPVLFPPTLPGPSTKPPWLTPGPKPAPTPEPKGIEGPTKKASAGDVLEAVSKVPEVKKALDHLKDTAKSQWDSMKPGEKVGTVIVGLGVAGGAVGGISSDPAARKAALDILNNKDIPVPGLDGVTVHVITTEGVGGGIKVDLFKVFGGK